jgi:hypothetical protein
MGDDVSKRIGSFMGSNWQAISDFMQKNMLVLVDKFADFAGGALKGAAGAMGDAVGSIVEMIASVAMQFATGLVSGIKTIGDETFGRFGKAAVGGNKALGSLGTGAGVVGGVVTASTIAAPFTLIPGIAAGAGASLLELSLQTESYSKWQKALTESTKPLVQAMEPLWQQLLPLTAVFYQVNFALGQFLGALIPGQLIARGLFDAVKFASEGILHAALAIGRMVNAMGGDVDTRAIAGSLHNLQDMTYQSAMAAASLEGLSDAARGAMNVPDVAKVSYARYLAMRDENGNMSADAAGLNREGDTTLNIYGNVSFAQMDEMAQAARDGHYKLGGNITSPRANLYQTG